MSGGVDVRLSEGCGRSLVAKRALRKNAVVAEYFGAVYEAADAQAYLQPGFVLDCGSGAVVVAHSDCASRYINHASSPLEANVVAEIWRVAGREGYLPRVLFRLSRAVKEGEELRFRYSKSEQMQAGGEAAAPTCGQKRKR